MKEIPSSTAKDQLIKINQFLNEPHILIGGLAVQQYHPARYSSDIDIICNDQIAKAIIENLYPTKQYEIKEANEDDFRPAYIITSREHEGKVILIGPKITERESYKYINWENLLIDAKPFSYKNQSLENIKVPSIEMLAFTKLLSFLDRVLRNKRKGEQDLNDFVNLTNNPYFRINLFIDIIKKNRCGVFVNEQLNKISESYSLEIWKGSSIYDLMEWLAPALLQITKDEGLLEYEEMFMPENSILFYERIAPLYDSRNTKFLYEAHQTIIGNIYRLLPSGGSIIDIGCGTGRQIAAHFIHRNDISWLGIDGSRSMLDEFESHTRNSTMTVNTTNADLSDLDWSSLPATDLCLISFTLSSLQSIECIIHIADLVKPGGYMLIADIHPSYTLKRPYYDFETLPNRRIALRPNPVYPEKIAEYLLQRKFVFQTQKTITDDKSRDYAFISIYWKQTSEDKGSVSNGGNYNLTRFHGIVSTGKQWSSKLFLAQLDKNLKRINENCKVIDYSIMPLEKSIENNFDYSTNICLIFNQALDQSFLETVIHDSLSDIGISSSSQRTNTNNGL